MNTRTLQIQTEGGTAMNAMQFRKKLEQYDFQYATNENNLPDNVLAQILVTTPFDDNPVVICGTKDEGKNVFSLKNNTLKVSEFFMEELFFQIITIAIPKDQPISAFLHTVEECNAYINYAKSLESKIRNKARSDSMYFDENVLRLPSYILVHDNGESARNFLRVWLTLHNTTRRKIAVI